MINGSQSHIEETQQSAGQQRQDDATGSQAVRGGQAAVLGRVLRRGAREGLQAAQNHAGAHQAVLHVRNTHFPVPRMSFACVDIIQQK